MKHIFNKTKRAMLQNTQPSPYISPSWQQHADLVAHLSQFSQNVLLVIAPQGGGKSTFLHHIKTLGLPTLKRVNITASPKDTYETLMQKIAKVFDFAWTNIDNLNRDIHALIAAASAQNVSVALLVDDAHLLNDLQIEALLHLTAIEKASDKLLHLVLLGEPSLELRLCSKEWASSLQGRTYTIELESWTLEDIHAYWSRDPHAPRLNEQQLKALFEKSGGLPGEVVSEKSPAIEDEEEPLSHKQKTNIKEFWGHPILVGILIGGFVGVGYLVFSGLPDLEQGQSVHLAQQAEEGWDDAPIQPRSVRSDFQLSSTTASETLEDDFSSDESERTTPLANPPLPVAMVPMQEELPAVTAAPVEEAIPVAAVAPIAMEPKKASEKNNPALSLSKQEQHLLSLKNGQYTLQLIGARTENNVKQFIARHGIDKQAYSYKTKLSGKDWYVVVYGEYPSKEAAKQAAAKIPESLKRENLKPWIREVDSIHHDIRQSRKA